jgi:hypothetical protein
MNSNAVSADEIRFTNFIDYRMAFSTIRFDVIPSPSIHKQYRLHNLMFSGLNDEKIFTVSNTTQAPPHR